MCEFPVHKVIMAVSNDYFTTMFKCNFKEQNRQKIMLERVEAIAIMQILTYAYTGKLSVNEDIVLNLQGEAKHVSTEIWKKYLVEGSHEGWMGSFPQPTSQIFHSDLCRNIVLGFIS